MSLLPYGSPDTSMDMMLMGEAETKQVPPNSHETHLCLSLQGCFGGNLSKSVSAHGRYTYWPAWVSSEEVTVVQERIC